MIRSAESVEIARKPDEVFAYVSDLRNEPAWHVDVVSLPSDVDVPPVPGKSYTAKMKPFMGKDEGTFTAIEVEPGSRIVMRAAMAGFTPTLTYTVEPAGDGARFTRAVEMKPTGFAVLMTPMMKMMVPRRNKVFVQNLKRVLESQG
jgi:uncharacterized protein YndB with AHSA1/START domain